MSPQSAQSLTPAELRHELRTPLNHIVGYSEMLAEDYAQPAVADCVREIRAVADRMLAEIQRAAGQDKTEVAADALEALQKGIDAGVSQIRTASARLRSALPSAGHRDVDRIEAAAGTLQGALSGAPGRSTPPAAAEPRRGASAIAGRILVVDDNEMNRDVLSRQLEKHRHEVETAPDGETALRMLRQSRFDIMLLDLMMPGMNGFEVLEAVKRDAAVCGVAVILVSALDEMEGVARSIEAGAEDYLFKPVNPTLLRARVSGTLEKLRAQESLRRKQRLESIGLLASGIAHDFNNLLTGIIGHAQLLEQILGDDTDREMAQSIVTAGERAAELTRQLLAYSGKGMFLIQPLDPARVLREAEPLISAALPRRVRLVLNLNATAPVSGDRNQLVQALLNLIINAGEAVGSDENGVVYLESGVEHVSAPAGFQVSGEEFTPGWYSWFEVRDDGCGMNADELDRIFEPFYSTKFLGRGLGLAAVAGIIRSHKGMLRVNSTPGQGTAMRVYMPVIAGEEPRQASETRPAVLVVDDEPVVRRIVKVALERSGHTVIMAESGEAAIDLFRRMSHSIQLVLLDWRMPVMDGSETLARLREIRADVRVIVSSGFARSEAEETFRLAGVTGYLQKPYRMSELVEMVGNCSV